MMMNNEKWILPTWLSPTKCHSRLNLPHYQKCFIWPTSNFLLPPFTDDMPVAADGRKAAWIAALIIAVLVTAATVASVVYWRRQRRKSEGTSGTSDSLRTSERAGGIWPPVLWQQRTFRVSPQFLAVNPGTSCCREGTNTFPGCSARHNGRSWNRVTVFFFQLKKETVCASDFVFPFK